MKTAVSRRMWLPSALLGMLGVVVLATTPWVFSHERWVMDDPDRSEHVFTLAKGQDGLYRGSQNGALWRLEGQEWHRVHRTDRGAIMTLLPDRRLAVLNGGLWDWGTDTWLAAPAGTRVSHAVPAGHYLLLATGNGVLAWDGDGFRNLGLDAQVYRLHAGDTATGLAIHAGTIGDGIWRLEMDRPADGWQPVSQGLPRPVNILSLLEADNGALLAGTDQGLFWRADGRPWRRVEAGLGQRRVLALALDAEGMLWAGSDDGAYRIRLVQRERALETQGRWEKLRNPPEGLDRPVSWVVPYADTIWISAGATYRLDRVAGPHIYQQMAVGLLLIALALYLLRRRMTGREHGTIHTEGP